MPGRVDLVRCDADPLHVLGHALEPPDHPPLRHLLHQLLAIEAAPLGDLLEDRVDEGEVPVPDDMAEGDGEYRLDPGGAAGDNADRPGRRDSGDGRVAKRLPVLVDAPVPAGE